MVEIKELPQNHSSDKEMEYQNAIVPDSELNLDSEHVSDSDSDLPKESEAAMDKSNAKPPLSKASTSIASAKRQNETILEPTPSNSKKAKQTKFTAEEKMKQVTDPTPSSHQRLFSEDDEILILQGLIEFIEKNGNDSNMSEFYDVIAKSLNPDINRRQLIRKVSRLKTRFEDNESKKGDNESPIFSKPHDQKVFELSNKVWGVTTATTHVVNDDFHDPLGVVFSDYSSHYGLDDVEDSRKIYLVERWFKFKLAECKYFFTRAKLEIEMQTAKMNVYKEIFRQ